MYTHTLTHAHIHTHRVMSTYHDRQSDFVVQPTFQGYFVLAYHHDRQGGFVVQSTFHGYFVLVYQGITTDTMGLWYGPCFMGTLYWGIKMTGVPRHN